MTCVCEHPKYVHRRGGDGRCHRCDCPWFCTPEEADYINQDRYEDALADGEPWAVEAYERRHL